MSRLLSGGRERGKKAAEDASAALFCTKLPLDLLPANAGSGENGKVRPAIVRRHAPPHAAQLSTTLDQQAVTRRSADIIARKINGSPVNERLLVLPSFPDILIRGIIVCVYICFS
jgi:hypothetical protein